MDRHLQRRPAWRRHRPYAAGALLVAGIAAWLLPGRGGTVYRVPIDRLTVAMPLAGART
jgi:hypothetical protein